MDTSLAWVTDVFLVLFFLLLTRNENRKYNYHVGWHSLRLRVGLISINQPLNEEIQSRHSFSLLSGENSQICL